MFAQFQSVGAIQLAIEAEFGVRMDRRDVQHYDCSKPDARVGKRLRELYVTARESYISDTTVIAISHQTHRLRLLERLVEKAETRREFDVALKGLRQAAEEMGGVLTKERVVKHEGNIAHVHMSIEDARAELALRLSAYAETQPMIELKPLIDKDNVAEDGADFT